LPKRGKFDKLIKILFKKYYRLNQFIRADQVRVVDETGKLIGVMPVSEALKKAQSEGLDLVEIAPKAQPPVVKIINFKKFQFLESKKEQESKRKTKKVDLKEVRLSPFIAENDMYHRLKKAEEFLKEGNKVKISILFRGREMTKKEFGQRLLEKAKQRLSGVGEAETEPKFAGRQMEILMTPVKGGNNVKTKDEDKKISQPKV